MLYQKSDSEFWSGVVEFYWLCFSDVENSVQIMNIFKGSHMKFNYSPLIRAAVTLGSMCFQNKPEFITPFEVKNLCSRSRREHIPQDQ